MGYRGAPAGLMVLGWRWRWPKMNSRPRCACCRRAFTLNYRNRSKTKYPQRYCGLAACRRASLRDSQRRYRRREPEEPSKVRNRVRDHREQGQARRRKQAGAPSPARFRGTPEGATPAPQREARPGEEVLARLVEQLFVHFPVLAERVVGEGCNANAAGTSGSSRTGI